MREAMWQFVVGNHVEKELAGDNYTRGQHLMLQMKMLGSLCCTACLRSWNWRRDSARNTGFILSFPHEKACLLQNTQSQDKWNTTRNIVLVPLTIQQCGWRARLIRRFAQVTPPPSSPQWLYYIYHHMLWCWENSKLESIMGRKAWQRWEVQDGG